MEKAKCYLELQDLVGNLFITLKQAGINEDRLSYRLIDTYADLLLEELSKQHIDVYFRLSRELTDQFLDENQNLYEESADGKSIVLLEDLSASDLVKKYRGYLTVKVLIALVDKGLTIKVLQAYKEDKIRDHKETIKLVDSKIKDLKRANK